MLVQVALLVFAMCAVLSLVIDVGYARVTQTQLQSAADAAAIEGLRKRNVGTTNAAGQAVDDAFASDCLRRAAANRVVRRMFDDDLDPANGDADYQFGAGPLVELTDGVTSAHALQTISIPEAHSYKPDLQMNQRNEVYGDMVSGRFCYTSDPVASEGSEHEVLDIVCTEPQRGSGAFTRNDFNPNGVVPNGPPALQECPAPDDTAPAPWPLSGGSLTGVDNSAFLVRLRRSNELREFEGQTEPDVASSGPALPLIPGKGAAIYGDDAAGGYSVRRDGLTVRATAIAGVRPAMHVGLPVANPARPGVTPFSLADTFVQTITVARQLTIDPATGVICAGTTCTAATPPASQVGRFVDNLAAPTRARWQLIATVGQPLPAAIALNCAAAGTISGFGPVFSVIGNAALRIIGFSRITLAPDTARPGNPCAKVVTRGPSAVAPANATAALAGGLPLPVTIQAAAVRELMNKHLQRAGTALYAPVLAPAIVR